MRLVLRVRVEVRIEERPCVLSRRLDSGGYKKEPIRPSSPKPKDRGQVPPARPLHSPSPLQSPSPLHSPSPLQSRMRNARQSEAASDAARVFKHEVEVCEHAGYAHRGHLGVPGGEYRLFEVPF